MLAFKMKYTRDLASLVTMLIVVPGALGQESSQYDKGTPPQHAAGVSPLGSYTSSDLGTINLSNGALNIKLPLTSVGGRGFSLPLTLNYSSKVWSASRHSNFADETGNHPVAHAAYADIENLMDLYSRVAPGWTIGAAPTLVVRGNGIKDDSASLCAGDFRFALTKLTVILPDKGEIQLRDDVTNGAPLATQVEPSTGCMARDGNRGQRWHASDGSGIVFVSDTANGIVRGDLNGVLMLADGTRYRFASLFNPPSGSPPLNLMSVVKLLARSTSITDRNGNLITITNPSASEVRYTDQLGRVTKIEKNVADPTNPSVTLAFLVTVPGYQGQNRYFKIKSAVMNQRYRPGINPTLPVINGDYDPLGWGLSWGTATRLFPFSHGGDAERIDVMTVMSEFVLPDGRAIEFFYNQFGEVAEVRLPTGGKLQYDYQYVSTLPAGKSHIGEVDTVYFDSNVADVDRSVVARRTYEDGVNLEGSWSHAYTNATTQVTATSASGAVLLNQKHYFMASQRYLNSPPGSGPIPDRGTEGTGYSLWSTGVESRTEMLDAPGTAVIVASEQDWTQRVSMNWSAHTTYAQEQPENNNRVNQTRRYLDNGMMAKTETFYDQYNNPIEIKEYDYNQALKRRTVKSYLSINNGFNYQTDDAIHLLSLPETTTVFNETGTQVAQSTMEYDVYTDDGNHGLLTAYGSVSQHDSNYGVSKLTRGNVTRIAQWLNTTGAFIYSYSRFDVLGNVVSTKDANGKVTTVSFADDFGSGQTPGTPSQNPATPTYALPTLITSPPPLPGAPVHTARSQYDYSTGLLTGFRDRNDVVTQTIYSDPFNRPTLVKAALGVEGVETHVSNYYAPATAFGITLARNDVLTASDLNDVDDASIRSWTVTDGFGRTREMWKRDPQGDVKVITDYDALNRVKQTSNPFRPATESAAFTITVYDVVGRVTSVTTPDNAVVNTSYSGNSVTVTDQAGKKRKSVSDALGRLTDVWEDPEVPGGPAELNYQTTYLYDALDNLAKVTQDSQQRFFMYDSLKRLIRARNPEQGTLASLNLTDPITSNNTWSVGYEYDSNGNLIKKTDARGVESNYVYDAFNRNTTIDYTDTAINPDVKRFYDGATKGKGRFWQFHKGGDLTNGLEVDHTSIDSYDEAGRPLIKRQLFKTGGNWSPNTYQIERTYNRGGGVKTQKYPSLRSVTYNYDVAGRLADDGSNLAFKGNLGDGVERTYARGITYSPWGGVSREQYGTNAAVYNKLHYNIRGQLCDVRASNVDQEWSGELGSLVNHYSTELVHCGSGADNNGNLLMSQTIINSNFMEDRYSYDALNRLTAVDEWQNGATHTGSQQYEYDRWGNRTIKPATWGTGINNKQFAVDTPTNRLYAPGDLALPENQRQMRYDSAGNLINDTYTGAGLREYDAENRMTRAWGGDNQSQYYTYNADGQRTRRKINGQEIWQVYGFEGELLAEYAANGAVASPQKEYGYRNGQLLITAEAAGNPTVPLFADDFNDNSLDPSKWVVMFPTGTPPVTEEAQQIRMTLAPNTAGYNGVSSNSTFDVTGKMVQVEVAQAVSQAGWCENMLELQLNANNTFLVNVGGGNLLMRSRVNGVNDQTSILYDGGAHRHWRLRHDSTANTVNFETSADGNVWITRKTVTPGFALTSLRIYLVAGAWGTGNGAPGAAKYDNVKLLSSSAGPSSITIPNSGFETPSLGFGNFQYGPTGGSWSFINGAGISAGGSGFTGGPFPQGSQVAFIQSNGEFSQSLSGFQANTNYVVTFSAAQRINCCNPGGQQFAVYLDGTLLGTFNPPMNGVDVEYSTAAFTTTSGLHTLKFVGLNPGGQAGFIDHIRITGSPVIGNGVQWLVSDHLGTPRMIIDETGTLGNIKRHDYLPFGEELFAPAGGRSANDGYSGVDAVRQQFTQKERDNETGLDYFEARYYGSAQGRFTSPDEFTGGPEELYYFADDASANPTFYSDLRRPQSLNKYQYAYNNPLRWIDPDGHEPDDDPQKKKKEEDIDVVVIKTVDPKIVSFDVKLIDKVPNTGEVPVGGEFEIKYKYVINEPTDGSKPEDAGSIAPITPKGTFTESNQVGLVNSTVKVDREKEAVTVEKTERYVVNERRESRPGATAAINYKVVVKDPNTGRVVERRSTEGRGYKYIPIRNVPKEPRKNRN